MSHAKFHGFICAVVAMVLMGTLAGPAWGTQSAWVGGTGNWQDANYWSGGVPAHDYDTAIVDGGEAKINGINAFAGILTVGSLGTGTVLQQSGTLQGTDTLTLGDYESGKGTYQLQGGVIGGFDGLVVGSSGTGRFIQSGGYVEIYTDVNLGENTGSQGRVELSGGTFLADVELSVGVQGAGSFIQSGGYMAVLGSMNLGGSVSSHGYAELSSGTLYASDLVSVGFYGQGTFVQTGGSCNLASCIQIGSHSSSYGLYQLSGGTMNVGDYFYVGVDSGSQGSFLISQPNDSNNAYCEANCPLELGQNGGTGTFTQTGGTVVCRTFVAVGSGDGSQGSLMISGGSFLSSSGTTISVGSGSGAQGVLNITGGSLKANGPIVMAGGSASTAQLYVAKAATVQVGGLTINSGSGRSTKVSMEIDSNGHSFIGSSGTVSLAGALNIQSLNNYRPNQGDAFTLITSTGMSGNFSSLTSNLINSDANANVMGLLIRDANATDPNLKYWSAFRGGVAANAYVLTFQGAMAGDATADNVVNGNDFGALARNWMQSGKIWTDGDFNGNGTVDGTDFGALARNWGLTGLTPEAAPPPPEEPIPEPVTATLLAAGGLALLRGRRRFGG
jgi:hypothetical protein